MLSIISLVLGAELDIPSIVLSCMFLVLGGELCVSSTLCRLMCL